jgi:HAMP domain-containing protein
MVVQPLPRALARNALAVQAAYSEYQQRALARDSLRRMYIGTLTLALILAVFGAVLLAILLGNQLARPLLLLADGVRQVARGDLTAKPVFASGDELGGLTRSFADMTAQLAEAREQVQRGVAQLEGARTRLQTILDTLTAGVIVFDREGRIDTVNPGATRILRQPAVGLARPPPGRGARAGGLCAQRRAALRAAGAPAPRPASATTGRIPSNCQRGDGTTHDLLVRGATLPGGRGCWCSTTSPRWCPRSAARLGRGGAPPGARDQEPADAHPAVGRAAAAQAGATSSKAPTRPAAALGGHHREPGAGDAALVNEFRDYARLPAAQLQPLDLNALVHRGAGAVRPGAGQRRCCVAHLEPDLPRILGDATQLRQVIHNLVQNALDAVADRPRRPGELITEHRARRARRTARRAPDGDRQRPRLCRQGAQAGLRALRHHQGQGHGAGLAVVKKIADEHGARLRARQPARRATSPTGPVTGPGFRYHFPALPATPAAARDRTCRPRPGGYRQRDAAAP